MDAKGNAVQLDTVQLNRWSRLKAWAKPSTTLPTAQVDRTLSELGTTALAAVGGAAVGGPWVAVGAVFLKAHDFYKEAQTLATNKQMLEVVDATANWAASGIKAGRTPMLNEAYTHYADDLYHDDIGETIGTQRVRVLAPAEGQGLLMEIL